MKLLHEVKITAVYHNNEGIILIQCPPDNYADNIIRELPECHWSESFHGWCMKNNPDNLRLIFRTFKGIATIDKSPERLKYIHM